MKNNPVERKKTICIMLDTKTLDFFKAKAGTRGYQALINDVLRQKTDTDGLSLEIQQTITETKHRTRKAPLDRKKRISIMVDTRTIDYFKSKAQGRGYQTLINGILRIETERPTGTAPHSEKQPDPEDMASSLPGRPKSTIERKTVNTKLDPEVIDILKRESDRTGIPQNRLIENAVKEKYGTTQGDEKP